MVRGYFPLRYATVEEIEVLAASGYRVAISGGTVVLER